MTALSQQGHTTILGAVSRDLVNHGNLLRLHVQNGILVELRFNCGNVTIYSSSEKSEKCIIISINCVHMQPLKKKKKVQYCFTATLSYIFYILIYMTMNIYIYIRLCGTVHLFDQKKEKRKKEPMKKTNEPQRERRKKRQKKVIVKEK